MGESDPRLADGPDLRKKPGGGRAGGGRRRLGSLLLPDRKVDLSLSGGVSSKKHRRGASFRVQATLGEVAGGGRGSVPRGIVSSVPCIRRVGLAGSVG